MPSLESDADPAGSGQRGRDRPDVRSRLSEPAGSPTPSLLEPLGGWEPWAPRSASPAPAPAGSAIGSAGRGRGRTSSRRDGVRRPGRSLLLSVTGGRGFGASFCGCGGRGCPLPRSPLPLVSWAAGRGGRRAVDAGGPWASGPRRDPEPPVALRPPCFGALTLPSPNPAPRFLLWLSLPLRLVPSIFSHRDPTPALPPPPHHPSCVSAVSPLTPTLAQSQPRSRLQSPGSR